MNLIHKMRFDYCYSPIRTMPFIVLSENFFSKAENKNIVKRKQVIYQYTPVTARPPQRTYIQSCTESVFRISTISSTKYIIYGIIRCLIFPLTYPVFNNFSRLMRKPEITKKSGMWNIKIIS